MSSEQGLFRFGLYIVIRLLEKLMDKGVDKLLDASEKKGGTKGKVIASAAIIAVSILIVVLLS